jgi:arginyl-tRNA synthetase
MYALDKIKQHIIELINKRFDKENVELTDLSYPPDSGFGDISLPCFKLGQEFKKSPGQTAEELLKEIKPDEIISGLRTAGPYLNFFINKNYLIKNTVEDVLRLKDKYGSSKELEGKRIMIEFAHPNPFKSFHIGHLRNIILGESLVRIFESQGAELIRTNYQGDVGMHIAKCLWSFRDVDPSEYPKTADEKVALLGKCYAQGARAFEEDAVAQALIKRINKVIYTGEDKEIKKLWELGKKWSLEKFHEIYERVYTRFDREYMESEVMDDGVKYVNEAIEKGILEESDGAIIFDGSPFKLDTRVFLSSEGLPTYEGKELGLAFREFNDFGKIDLCIHNVAVEQISFFKVTFKVQELLNPELFKGKQYHNAYEFVGLKKGKMSSRKGEVVLGNDILNQAVEIIKNTIDEKSKLKNAEEVAEKVGVGAVKYAFLKISPFKYLAFDMDECVSFEGDSGPYIQYTFVRTQSILRKLEIKDFQLEFDPEKLSEEKEKNLVLKLAKYPDIIKIARQNYDPSEVVKYLFELAKMFNDYYHSVPVIGAEKEVLSARIALIQSVGCVVKNGLDILGIKTVEKM